MNQRKLRRPKSSVLSRTGRVALKVANIEICQNSRRTSGVGTNLHVRKCAPKTHSGYVVSKSRGRNRNLFVSSFLFTSRKHHGLTIFKTSWRPKWLQLIRVTCFGRSCNRTLTAEAATGPETLQGREQLHHALHANLLTQAKDAQVEKGQVPKSTKQPIRFAES